MRPDSISMKIIWVSIAVVLMSPLVACGKKPVDSAVSPVSSIPAPAANEPTTPFVFDDGKRALLPVQPDSTASDAWSPTQHDAQRASDGIPAFLQSKSPKIAAKFSGYYGQLFGVTDGGARKIRLLFFCRLEPSLLDVWTKVAVIVNDGGDCYFNVDFDPSSGAYSNFRVNGDA
jgi:hypothetical protein